MANLCQKILLVEDDAADAELIRDMVESKEAQCVLATTDRISSALELLREGAFEVVLLDLALPDGKGLETLKQILDKGPLLPIVVLTVTADEELAAEAISMGAQDYLVKGRFDSDQLYRSMIYAMERKRYEQQLRDSEERLRQAFVGLEQRVQERTAELKESHEDLQKAVKERLKAEEQLRQAQKMEALGTLAGGIAHDFNNLLAAIIGFTELIRDHLPEESRERSHAKKVLEASLRGRDLVRQMLMFSRRSEEERKPLRLSSIVEETVKLLRASIPTTITIRDSVKSKSGVILGDPVQIQQVLMNLATNGAHAMRETGGVLDIELSDSVIDQPDGNPPEGLYVKLVVRDTGCGIPPEVMDKIFDPFFTTKKPGEGTGLGLSVVLGIVKQSHGYITAESEPIKGSTFTVYFPRIEEKPVIEAADGYGLIQTGHERILFVDDEKALVEVGEELLAELGYEVICRTSSREALALFRLDPSRFDLIITDQTMPELTGVEMAREMLVIRPDVPVILTTGFSHLVDADRALAAGIKAFAMKPLTKKELSKTIRKVLDE